MPAASIEFRRASEADLAGEFAAFVAAIEELRTRRGGAFAAAPFDPEGRWVQVHRHLLAHDSDRSFVAEEHGRIIGFTAALVRDDWWFLSAMFIHPEHQRQGVGRRLLDLAWDGTHERRITITEAIQPVSTGLYAQRGLLPITPVLGFAGQPSIDPPDSALQRAAPTPAALKAIDLAAYGVDRAVDHEFWARTSSPATVWLRDGEPCAYSYPGLWGIGPVAGCDDGAAAHALRAELAARANESVRVDIPGSATALLQVALDAGLTLDDPGLLLLSQPQKPPTALAIHSYWLM